MKLTEKENLPIMAVKQVIDVIKSYFNIGQRVKEFKYYDITKIKKILEHYAKLGLKSAALGMYEDWFWTAGKFWENGDYCEKFELSCKGSTWATPCIWVKCNKGVDFIFDVSIGGSSKLSIPSNLFGPILNEIQDTMPKLRIF